MVKIGDFISSGRAARRIDPRQALVAVRTYDFPFETTTVGQLSNCFVHQQTFSACQKAKGAFLKLTVVGGSIRWSRKIPAEKLSFY